MLCSGGLKSPNRPVNTEKARSIGASTMIERRTTAVLGWFMFLVDRLVDDFLVVGQRSPPEGVELVVEGCQSCLLRW